MRWREKKKAEKNRIFKWEKKNKIEGNSPHGMQRGEVVKEVTIESQTVRSLKLILEFDEKKLTELLRRFEKTVAEFNWSHERSVVLVASMLKGKALEGYDRIP